MEVSGQLHAPPLYSGKEPRYPLYRRLGGPQSRPGRHGRTENLIIIIIIIIIIRIIRIIRIIMCHNSESLN
jgi:hypothetical protein